MPVKSVLTKSVQSIEELLRANLTKFIPYKLMGESIMPAIIVEQNEVKGYTIPLDKVLYMSHENITSKNVVNITIFFETGQNLKLAYPTEQGLEVYADLQSQLGAPT